MVKRAKSQWSATPVTVLGAVVALVALVAGVITALSLGDGVDDNTTPLITALLGIVATAVPSVLALLKVEHVSSDIRNGVITEKAKEGAKEALEETGVTEATTGLLELDGPTIREALLTVLHNQDIERGKDNG